MPFSDNSLVIPFFIPHAGCPHQCSFCNQRTISGKTQPDTLANTNLEETVRLYQSYSRKKPSQVQLAFFGGNFLGMGQKTVIAFLDQAKLLHERELITSIRFSTRPDTITPEMMSIIRDYPVSVIEIGTQSMDPNVLELSRRGHSAEDTVKAAGVCLGEGYETGIQVMIGLPGEDEASCLATGNAVRDLKPDFVRIYPTVVVDGSPLAESFRKGEYAPLETQEAVKRAKMLYLGFKAKNIRVIRMGLQATEDLIPGTTVLAGPYHPAFGHLVFSSIMLDRIKADILKLFPLDTLKGKMLKINCNSRNISRVRGDRNENIRSLHMEYGLASVKVNSDSTLEMDGFSLELTPC